MSELLRSAVLVQWCIVCLQIVCGNTVYLDALYMIEHSLLGSLGSEHATKKNALEGGCAWMVVCRANTTDGSFIYKIEETQSAACLCS